MGIALWIACSCILADAAPEAPAGRRPNIVFILADDLGYGDLKSYNPDSKIATPHLDRLAAEGVRFTDAHSPSSVCSPTRYALLTGRYAWRTRLQKGVLIQWDPPLIEPDEWTLPKFLQRQGYRTACVGKWHLGWSWPTKDGTRPRTGEDRLSNVDFALPIGQGPTTRGFDVYFGTDIPNFPPYVFIDQDRTQGIPSVPDEGLKAGFNRPGPMLPGWKLVDILPALTRRAVQFVEESARRDEPFFLYLPLTSPHYPVVPSAEFQGRSGVGEYGDFVAQTDDCVGQVLAALKLAGVDNNTLVVFTSDNGPEVTGEVNPGCYDRLRKYEHASMGALRGAKRDLWEGGHRVPYIAKWPRQISAGSVSTQAICHVDWFATVAALLGQPLPEGAAPDSESMWRAYRGEPLADGKRGPIIHHSGSGKFAIRRGDWVLIDAPTGDDNRQAGEPEWFKKARGYANHSAAGELYNLRDDLAQHENLIETRPELVEELRTELTRLRERPAARR